MKLYLASLSVGVLVGVIYALFGVRSPAPPVIALVGLLGILIGEQLPPLVQKARREVAATLAESRVDTRASDRTEDPRNG